MSSINEEEIISNKKKEYEEDIQYLKGLKEKTEKNIDEWQDEIKKDYKRETGKEYNKDDPPDMLVEEVESSKKRAKKKQFGGMMTAMVLGGVILIGALMVLAGYCESGNVCNGDANVPLIILQSQLMLVIVAMVIGPAVGKILKEKYGIQIEEGQISMVFNDALNAVKMYSSEANSLRDSNGKLSDANQKKLRNLAFASMKNNFDGKRYTQLVSEVGVQVMEKAIERAAKDEKFERLPFDKKQILDITRQAMNAFPMIVEWKNKDPELKQKFVAGHITRLLTTMGVDGYAYKTLENFVDSEANKRIMAAAIADKNKLLDGLKLEDPYLKYTSIVLSAVGEILAKPVGKSIGGS